MKSSTKWVVRFELLGGSYTSTTIRRESNPLEWHEVQEWAEAQARARKDVLCVDEVYALEAE